MFFELDRASISKHVLPAVAALVLFAPSTEACHAYGIDSSNIVQPGPTVHGGAAVMLSLRVPFGGESTTRPRSMLGLSFGSTWRDAPEASSSIGYRFVPTAELGLTFTGEPIVRLGSFDMTANGANLEVSNAQGESFCGRNLALCIVGGVAIIAAIIAVAAPSRDSDELLGPYPYPPPN